MSTRRLYEKKIWLDAAIGTISADSRCRCVSVHNDISLPGFYPMRSILQIAALAEASVHEPLPRPSDDHAGDADPNNRERYSRRARLCGELPGLNITNIVRSKRAPGCRCLLVLGALKPSTLCACWAKTRPESTLRLHHRRCSSPP